MKKFVSVFLIMTTIVMGVQAQVTLKKVLQLQMPKTADDDLPGTRGASVMWHPLQKKYYAVFAGNEGYPGAVFDATGKRLSSEDLTTMIDTRGLWFDPVTRKIMGNSYNEFGWFRYKLDGKGIPIELENVLEGMYQPNDQCIGVYNPVKKQVLFLEGDLVYSYNAAGEQVDSVLINWGVKKAGESSDDYDPASKYNYNALIYTGIKNQELGFLNTEDRQIELYNISTGLLTKTMRLPDDASAEPSFNFAYANGIYWLFDMELRKWVGYK